MNLDEAVELLTVVSAIPAKKSAKHPEIRVVHAIGISPKTPEGAEAAFAWADVLMVEYHLNDRSFEQTIAEAAQRGIGIVVKKGLASGTLPPAEAIRFVLRNPHVHSLVVGGLSLEHIKANARAAAPSRP